MTVWCTNLPMSLENAAILLKRTPKHTQPRLNNLNSQQIRFVNFDVHVKAVYVYAFIFILILICNHNELEI